MFPWPTFIVSWRQFHLRKLRGSLLLSMHCPRRIKSAMFPMQNRLSNQKTSWETDKSASSAKSEMQKQWLHRNMSIFWAPRPRRKQMQATFQRLSRLWEELSKRWFSETRRWMSRKNTLLWKMLIPIKKKRSVWTTPLRKHQIYDEFDQSSRKTNGWTI